MKGFSNKRKAGSLIIIGLFMAQILILSGYFAVYAVNNGGQGSSLGGTREVNTNGDGDTGITRDTDGGDGNGKGAMPNSASTVDSWWNESYTHRILVKVTEPNIYPRTNEPVNVYLEFEPSTHRYNTTRVVKYIEATQ
ncbi:MAG: hypothetical protein ACTSVC_07855, partial [Promethearchaeota archaeon]